MSADIPAAARRKKMLQFVFGLVVGAACLFYALRSLMSGDAGAGMTLGDLKTRIFATAAWVFPVNFVLFFCQLVLRAERWRRQLQGLTGKSPSFRNAFAWNTIGNAAVFLLPFRLGEFVRPNLAAQRGVLRASAGLALSAVERVVDGIVTIGCFGLLLLFLHDRNLPSAVYVGLGVGLGVFGGALVFFIAAFALRARTLRLVEKVLGVFHGGFATRISQLLHAFLDGLACFRSTRDLIIYVVLTIGFWALNGASIWVLLLGMNVHSSPVVAFFTMSLLVIGVMIPAPPGNVGTFHLFASMGPSLFGADKASALAFAFVLHAWSVVAVVVSGFVAFAVGGVSLSRFRLATDEKNAEKPEEKSSQVP